MAWEEAEDHFGLRNSALHGARGVGRQRGAPIRPLGRLLESRQDIFLDISKLHLKSTFYLRNPGSKDKVLFDIDQFSSSPLAMRFQQTVWNNTALAEKKFDPALIVAIMAWLGEKEEGG